MTSSQTKVADLLGGAMPQPEARGNVRPLVMLIVFLALLGFSLGEWVIDSRTDNILGAARHRAEVILQNRGEAVSGWLESWRTATAPLRDNPTVQLFAGEAVRPGAALDPDLVSYMQVVVDEFFHRRPEVVSAYFFDAEGRAFLAASGGATPADAQRQAARALFPDGVSRITPLRPQDGTLVYDVYLPLRAAQAADAAAARKVVAVLAITVKADRNLADALAPGRTLDVGERLSLVQGDAPTAVAAIYGSRELTPVKPETLAAAARFAQAVAPDPAAEAYVLTEAAAGTPWRVLYARDADVVRGEIVTTRIVVTLLVLAFIVTVAAGIVALWWRQSLQAGRQLTEQYRDFAARLDAQHRLLNSINDAIAEDIFVIDRSRRVVYANGSFGELAGRPARECIGAEIDSLLAPHFATRLAEIDGDVLAGKDVAMRVVKDGNDDRPRWFAVSKVPFVNGSGAIAGVITVCRDVTEMQLERQRQQRRLQNTIRVLTSSVAAADPYLANHAGRMADVASGIAHNLDCSREEVATLETAANLSQIGKIFLPHDLVRKEARLSKDERKELERHIDLALEALKGIEFDLPVPDTLAQMHERLDGSGYPRGLAGEGVSLLGRIIGVADVFAARTEPRSYRNAAAAADILDMLRSNADKYDPRVVDALADYLAARGELEKPDAPPPQAG